MRFLWFGVVLFFISCEKEIRIDIAPQDEVAVIYSFIYPDSTFKLHLSKSVTITSKESYGQIRGGSFVVRRNGSIVLNQAFPSDTVQGKWPALKAGYGDTLDIQVFADREGVLRSRTVIPVKVPITKTDTITEIRKIGNGEPKAFVKFMLGFDENHSTTDFYQVVVVRQAIDKFGVEKYNVIEFKKEDPVFLFFEQGGGFSGLFDFKGLFSDVLINGQSYVLNFLVDKSEFQHKEFEQSGTLKVYLYHHTYDYFAYLKSYVLFKGSDLIPVFDPVKIHSNVTNGLGLFSGMAFDVVEYELKKE